MNTQCELLFYHNTTEDLVVAELTKQLGQFPSELCLSINQSEVMAYALNRLPPLYCTTIEGAHWQRNQTQQTLAKLLRYAVKYGIMRVAKLKPVTPTARLMAQECFRQRTALPMQPHGVQYVNAMVGLVQAELARQLQYFTVPIARFLDQADAIAYALNRLPTLYCTTQEGQQWQQESTQKTMGDFIYSTVKCGIRIAQKRDRRFDTPLSAQQCYPEQFSGFIYPLAS